LINIVAWTYFGVRVPRALDYLTMNFNLHLSVPCDHNTRRPRRTDEHHDNSAAIRSNERIAR